MQILEVIKRNRIDNMKSVSKSSCGCTEYYGCVIMSDGINYCRQCIQEKWLKENPNIVFTPKELLRFPVYSDGINYLEQYPKQYLNDRIISKKNERR